jgi:hypothetical protein
MKLRRKMPARETATPAFTARSVRSSLNDNVSCVSTRTSGCTGAAFTVNVPAASA